MITWTRPSGAEIETNDLEATVLYCESLGWEEKKAKKKPGPKPKVKKDGDS